jgi:hypothetical protein
VCSPGTGSAHNAAPSPSANSLVLKPPAKSAYPLPVAAMHSMAATGGNDATLHAGLLSNEMVFLGHDGTMARPETVS